MTLPTILVADDDRSIRTVLTQALGRAGYQVRSASNAATLWHWIEEGEGDLVITDVVMPDENGLDLIPRIKKLRPDMRVIVMSAQSTLMTAVKATQRGAFEYLPKPFDLQELVATVGRALAQPAEGGVPHEAARDADERLPLIGRSPAMQEIYRTIARLTTADLTVMINGESGTGKELVARALHDYGKRRGGPFVAINMAAIPRDLIESELFGHERGAFTGATNRSQGRFEQANGGTLFLDEIGDVPASTQVKLLRVIETGEFEPVGSNRTMQSQARLIAASNLDLQPLVETMRFRPDLYYRLNVVPLLLPPLRERDGDVALLSHQFLTRFSPQYGKRFTGIKRDTLRLLEAFHWPGNVRQLVHAMQQVAVLHDASEVEVSMLPTEILRGTGRGEPTRSPGTPEEFAPPALPAGRPFPATTAQVAISDPFPFATRDDILSMEELERRSITRAIELCRTAVEAANQLGISPATIYRKIKLYGIDAH